MDIIPAIDIREGACARIFGDAEPASVYTDDPLEQAIVFKQLGAKTVRLTDLDACFCGHPCNLPMLREMVDYSGVNIQLAGGVRTMGDIDMLMETGVDELVLGVHVLRDQELTKAALAKYGERLIPGLDCKDGIVSIEGFETSVSRTLQDLLQDIKEVGFRKYIYTDLHRHGSMRGPDVDEIRDILSLSDMQVTAAGGIADYDSLRRLKELGISRVIIGKALYHGVLKLDKAVAI